MSASVSILGNVGGNAELRYSNQGSAIASFPIASNSFRKTGGGSVQVTEWYNVTAFGKLAETIAANVRKGTQLLILGRLSFKPWMTKSGDPRAGAEVILQSFEFAGGNRSDASAEDSAAAISEPEYTGPIDHHPTFAQREAADSPSPDAAEPFENQF